MNKRKLIFSVATTTITFIILGTLTTWFYTYWTSHYKLVIYKKSEITNKEYYQVKNEKEIKEIPLDNFSYIVLHPYSGYRLMPSVKTKGKCLEENKEYIVSTNDRGFRSGFLGKKEKGVKRIAMIGGSAAFSGCTNDTTIIGYLSKILNEEGYKTEYINTGNLGFITTQELTVLVTDLLDLDVDLIISYDGFNDISTIIQAHGRIGWPMMGWTENSNRFNITPLFYPTLPKQPNGVDIIYKLLDIYLNNIKKMAIISKAFHINFIAVLQPTRARHPFQYPFDYFKKACKKSKKIDKVCYNSDYFYYTIQDTFEKWNKQRLYNGHYLSLLEFFDKRTYLYKKNDFVHIKDEGNLLVAIELAKYIMISGVLDDKRVKH